VRMWTHPATRRNLATLVSDGVRFVGPDDGAMACGEFGPGRLAEPQAIFEAIMAQLGAALGPQARPLAGKRAIVTAGPTAEPIDPVRLITNRSSGRQGYAIAGALAELGCAVTLVSGPTALPAPAGVVKIDIETAREMLAACEGALPADIAVCVAAVADWRPESAGELKLKKGEAKPTLKLVENPDVLAALCKSALRPKLVVGFAAETHDVEAHAKAKLDRKGCDWIIANDVSVPGTMGGGDNAVMLVTRGGVERWDRAPKDAVARQIAARIAEALA
jgi:phosphopantothenoylcysteine decarboxylase/phosphopantothenate--cysteine ligase